MRPMFLLTLVALLLAACAPSAGDVDARLITVIDGAQVIQIPTTDGGANTIIQEAGLGELAVEDRVLANGVMVAHDAEIAENVNTLQVRRAVPITLSNNGNQQVFNSAAFTVGEALSQKGLQIFSSDLLDPPAGTPILGPLTVQYQPAQELTITTDGIPVKIRSAAPTVGQALAAGGLPLIGLDYSQPDASQPLPSDGQIKVTHVSESVTLLQTSIPYNTEVQLTADLELDQQDMLQVGEPGLSVSRVRVRMEDGVEVARETEAEALVRPPQDRIIGAGTKIVLRTLDTPSGPVQYYRAVQVYATSYSPCRSGGSRCYPGTSGGLPVKRGVIGVTKNWWRYMNGDQVYVPGYGFAVISDIGGGIPGRYWIDLGYSDDDYEAWHGWTTLYFLAPPPATIMYVLE